LVTVTVDVVTVDESDPHPAIRIATPASAVPIASAGVPPSNFTRRF
jgi:hypothetical protein